jgi:hypothetical protein
MVDGAKGAGGVTVQAESDAVAHKRAVLEAHLAAAWLQRCGPSGKPGEWWIPGELLEVMDAGGIEVEVYPTFALIANGGQIRLWSPHLRPSPARQEAWEWRLGVDADDLSMAEATYIEDLGGCLDEYAIGFTVLGSHQEKPPIPPEVVKAMVYLSESEH